MAAARHRLRRGEGGRTKAGKARQGALACTTALALGFAGTATVAAQDATWIGNGTPSGNWETGTNWSPAGQPGGTATFGAASTTTVAIPRIPAAGGVQNFTEIGGIRFSPGASAYSFTGVPNIFGAVTVLSFTGAGIVNDSGVRQTFTLPGMFFDNASTAGSNVEINSSVEFRETSDAGSAVINLGGTDFAVFHLRSTAANATLNAASGAVIRFEGVGVEGGTAQINTEAGALVQFVKYSNTYPTPAGFHPTFHIGSLAGGGDFELFATRLFVGGNNLDTTVSGVIRDCLPDSGLGYCEDPNLHGGSLVKEGTGTLTLAGANTYAGGTTVAAGRLLVDGSVNGGVAVDGGALGGRGTVEGTASVAAGAALEGRSGQTLTLGGLVLQDGARTNVALGDPTATPFFTVAGPMTLGGAVNITDLFGGAAAPAGSACGGGVDTTYTLASAAARTGEFSGMTANFAFLTPVLSYDAANAYLTVTRNGTAFSNVGATKNQKAAGDGVESLGCGHPVYTAISTLSADEARHALDQLSGEIYASGRTVLLEDSRFVRDAAIDRLRAAGDGAGAAALPVMAYGPDGAEAAPADTQRFAVWGHAFGAWADYDGDGNAAGLDRSTGGFLAGADGLVGDWRIGFLTGFSHTSFDVDDRSSWGSSDNIHVGLYGGTNWGALAFRSGLAYTWHDVSAARTVSFGGFADQLSANYDAGLTQVFGELGYGIDAGAARFEPFANLAYASLHTDGFTEQGGAAALTSQAATTEATFTTLGVRAEDRFALAGMEARANGMVGWRHAFGDTSPAALNAIGGGGAFTVTGLPVAEDAFVAEAGLDFKLSEAATLGFAYDVQAGSDALDQQVSARLAIRF